MVPTSCSWAGVRARGACIDIRYIYTIYIKYLDIYLGEHLPDEARVPDRRVGEELHPARDTEPSLARGQQPHAGGDRLDSVSRY